MSSPTLSFSSFLLLMEGKEEKKKKEIQNPRLT